jgi:hypothetical protein
MFDGGKFRQGSFPPIPGKGISEKFRYDSPARFLNGTPSRLRCSTSRRHRWRCCGSTRTNGAVESLPVRYGRASAERQWAKAPILQTVAAKTTRKDNLSTFGALQSPATNLFIMASARRQPMLTPNPCGAFTVRLPGESAAAPESAFRRDANPPGRRPCAGGQSGTPCRVRGPCPHPPPWS